jgi:hypothetical protein
VPILLFPRPGTPTPPAPVDVGHRLVSAQLLDYDASVMPGDPLLNAFGVNWYDEWDGPGRGGCSLSTSEVGSADLLPGRYVNCMVETPGFGPPVPRFTFMIEGNPEYGIVKHGEEVDEIVTVQGRGWAAVLDGVTIYPEYALNFSLETTWRLFSFASPLFPNAGDWRQAVELAEYLEGVATANCYGHWQMASDGLPYPAPIGFPWPTNSFNLVSGVKTANYEDVFWLITPDQPDYASTGYLFYRGEFTLSELTLVTFDVTGDNFFTFFLEGVPILGEQISIANHLMWMGWKGKPVWLPAGTYTVAATVYNISFTDLGGGPVVQPACPEQGFAGGARDGNPAGLLASIYVAGDAITPPTAILMSNETWTAHYDEFFWPGWTPGQIIDQLISEGLARGCATVYNSVTYNDHFDSVGDPWRPFDDTYDREDIPTIAFKVGSSVMQALATMKEKGWIHWHVRPGTFILDVWRARLPVTPVAVATLSNPGDGSAGTNITEFTRNSTAPYANTLQVQWEGGVVIIEDTAAVTQMQTRVERSYSSNAGSEDEAALDGANDLFIAAQATFPALIAEVEPTGFSDAPYEGFRNGDYVEVITSAGTETVRCLSITCQQDPLGFAVWKCELNQKLDVPQRRNEQLLQQIGGKNQIIRGVFD